MPAPVPAETDKTTSTRISVVVPVHDEAAVLPEFARRLTAALEGAGVEARVLFVDDGSRDRSWAIIEDLSARDPRFQGLKLSRNFGKEIAIAAGLDHAPGDAVVLIDADLQQPPELIPRMIEAWRAGAKTVYGERIDRHSDGPARRLVSRVFYALYRRLAHTPLQERSGDFRLMDRQVVEALRRLPERARFTKGLYAWVGFTSVAIPYDHVDRAAGRSQWGFFKLLRLGMDGLTAFSSAPLRASTYAGLAISAAALLYGFYFLIRTLIYGPDVAGFPSLIISIMIFSGCSSSFSGSLANMSAASMTK